jgi:hypothetical protein
MPRIDRVRKARSLDALLQTWQEALQNATGTMNVRSNQTLRIQCCSVTVDNPPSTSMIRHMLHRASASAKGLAAALRRAVREWQMLSGWVRTGLDEMVRWAMVKAIIFGRAGGSSCQRHVNAHMSFCEGL